MRVSVLLLFLWIAPTPALGQGAGSQSFPSTISIGRCGIYSLGMSVESAKSTASSFDCDLDFLATVGALSEREPSKVVGGLVFLLDRLTRAFRTLAVAEDMDSTDGFLGVLFRSLANLDCTTAQASLISLGGDSPTFSTRALYFRCGDRYLSVGLYVRSDQDRDYFTGATLREEIME